MEITRKHDTNIVLTLLLIRYKLQNLHSVVHTVESELFMQQTNSTQLHVTVSNS